MSITEQELRKALLNFSSSYPIRISQVTDDLRSLANEGNVGTSELPSWGCAGGRKAPHLVDSRTKMEDN